MKISPEATLLLACVPACADRTVVQREMEDLRFKWERAYRLAECHGVVGIVAPVLHEMCPRGLPDDSRVPWRRRWEQLAMRDLTQLAALREILRVASQEGITPILLKGLAVHLQAYPKEAARGAADVDLLVPPEQMGKMAHCLQGLGFVFHRSNLFRKPLDGWSEICREHFEATFHRSSDGVSIDLHWRLRWLAEENRTGIRLSDRMWERPRRISLAGAEVFLPGREEELLMLCFHLLRSGPFMLRGLADAVRLFSIKPEVDWDRFLALAFETGMAPLGCSICRLVDQIDARLIPRRVESTLNASAKIFWILTPSLELNRLVEHQGKELTNVSIRWNGALYAARPFFWVSQIVKRCWQWLVNNLPLRLAGWRATVLYGDPCHYDRWRWLRKHLLSGPLRTLDAGCGSGDLTFYASKIGNEAVGISFDERNNEKAKTRAKVLALSNIQFFRVDLRELEKWRSQLGQFDQIVCFEVIEHIQQDRKLLSDLAALLKPKGRFLLTTPFQGHRPLFGEKLSQIEDGGHVRWGYTHEEIRALFGSCGLDVAREDFISGFISQELTWLMGRISRLDPKLAWVVTLPLRILQILDRPLTRLLDTPPLCIGVVGIKRV